MNAEYFLIAPAAVGRPEPIDKFEFDRSIETLGKVADELEAAGLKGAIEPIRAAETSSVHTFADAEEYIKELDHPAVQWINGDVYHMSQEEAHIGRTISKCGDRLVKLHLADKNRRALGEGMLNLDILLMSSSSIGYTTGEKLANAGPLGP